MTSHRYELTDEQQFQIEHCFPKRHADRPPKHSNRTMFNAMFWIARSGAPWRDLPERYGNWKSVYIRFSRWREVNLFEIIFEHLNGEPDFENLQLDSTIISAHQHSAGALKKGGHTPEKHIGSDRGGKSTKLHTITDALGNPIIFKLTAGQYNDSVHAISLLEQTSLDGVNVIADHAYGSKKIRHHIEENGGSYTILPKTNTKNPWETDWWLYKERHLIECYFNNLKHFRHIATRFDKLASSFLAFVQIATIFLLTK